MYEDQSDDWGNSDTRVSKGEEEVRSRTKECE